MEIIYTSPKLTLAIDDFKDPVIVGSIIMDNMNTLLNPDNVVKVNVPDNYKYRPERLALDYYGNESLYPLILAANNIGTLFHFIPELFNNTMNIPKASIIKQLFNL